MSHCQIIGQCHEYMTAEATAPVQARIGSLEEQRAFQSSGPKRVTHVEEAMAPRSPYSIPNARVKNVKIGEINNSGT